MAKIRGSHNPLLHGFSGSIGKTLVIRQTRNGIVLASRPGKRKRAHEAQLRTRERFKSASVYAQKQMMHWETKSMYQSGMKKQCLSAYQAAMTDYLSAPVIHSLNTESYNGGVGQQIEVFASDDFRVSSVELIIRNNVQEVVEQGTAMHTEDFRNCWVYVTEKENRSVSGCTVEARARDIPGNVTSRVMNL